jgi:hypothetical protein
MIKYLILSLITMFILIVLFITLQWWILTGIMGVIFLGSLYETIIKFTYFRTVRLKIKDITPRVSHDGVIIDNILKKKERGSYNWITLTHSIQELGVQKPLLIKETNKGYTLVDGNHRLKVLRELYGEDHTVKVRIINKII